MIMTKEFSELKAEKKFKKDAKRPLQAA